MKNLKSLTTHQRKSLELKKTYFSDVKPSNILIKFNFQKHSFFMMHPRPAVLSSNKIILYFSFMITR